MNGSLQVKNGYLYAVINYKDEAGKTKYKWIGTGLKERGNSKAAKEILDKELAVFEQTLNSSLERIELRKKPKEIDKSVATMPFVDYCISYVESIKNTLSPTVYYNYKNHYPKTMREYFDKQKLRLIDITSEEIDGFNNFLKKRGMKNVSIKHYACVIRPALRQAYKDKIIPDNPYDFVATIKKEKTKFAFYDKNEIKQLFEAIRGHKLELPFMLAAYYGFRRSEVLGLRWSAIDFDHKLISINHKFIVVDKTLYFSDELKTKSSNRTLPLIPVIEELLLEQKRKIEDNKQFSGDTYDTRYSDYVCVEPNGKIVYPDHMTKKFSDLLKDNNLKQIRLHDLRHSCASNMLASGVQMKEIQEWLGHSNFSTTADVYSHLDFSAKTKAANTLALAYGEPTNVQIVKPEESIIVDPMEILLQSVKEMKKLGFDTIDEFLAYKSEQANYGNKTAKKNDMEM